MTPSDSRSDGDTRKTVADHLYLDRGPSEASARCDVNARFGKVDLCEEMLRHLQLAPGQKVVDVGCGSGQHLVRFTEVVGKGGTARGFDFSPKAVAKARGLGVQVDVADGASLPVGDASFDALASSFSIYYLPDLEATLREWHRVVRPGGRIAISGPAEDTNAELYEFHLAVTGAGPTDSDKMALGYVAELEGPLRAAGFDDIEVHTFTNPIEFPTADDFVEYWSNTSLFARSVDDAGRADVLARGKKALRGKDGPFVITKRVAIAVGIRR